MKKLLIPLALLLVFASCKKSDSSSCTLSEASVAGTYKVTGATVRAAGTSTDINVFDTYFPDACDKSELTTFAAGGVLNVHASSGCPTTDDYTSTWSLSGSTLTIDGDPYTVKSFTCNTVVVTQTDGSGNITTVTVTRQ